MLVSNPSFKWHPVKDDLVGGWAVMTAPGEYVSEILNDHRGTMIASMLDEQTAARIATLDYWVRQSAKDVISMAFAGGMNEEAWHTDPRIKRACVILMVDSKVARRWANFVTIKPEPKTLLGKLASRQNNPTGDRADY